MPQVSAKFLPRLLTDYLLQRATNENLLENVNTTEKICVCGYDIEVKQQS
jgi:hypothetical protein